MNPLAEFLFLIVLVDTGSTIIGLNLGIFNKEINPVMAWYLHNGGTILFAAVKIGITTVAIGIIEVCHWKKIVSEKTLNFYYLLVIIIYFQMYLIFSLEQLNLKSPLFDGFFLWRKSDKIDLWKKNQHFWF